MTFSEVSGHKDMLLATGLSNLSKELWTLHNQVDQLEETIGFVIQAWKEIGRDDLMNIQQLDLVRQTLGELSDYVLDLKNAVPPDQKVSSAGLLKEAKLRDLAFHLGLPHSKPEDRGPPREEDIELF